MEWGAFLPEFDLQDALVRLFYMALAFVLALPLGLDREGGRAQTGLRTVPLVALASCGFILLAQSVFDDARAQARIVQGLITGVGFLGGGAIVQKGFDVHGTATAASIWVTAAIGAAVAYGRLEIAVGLSLANFLVLRGLRPLKDELDGGEEEEEIERSGEGVGPG